MPLHPLKIDAERSLFSGLINIYIATQDTQTGLLSSPEPIEMRPREKGVAIPPLLQLNPTDAQILMDSLWHCGLRPSEGTGSAGALAATEKHLEDMRKIAFRSLSIS